MSTMMMSGKVDEGAASRNRNNRNSFFREEQTDLLNPFQGHHYDLLAGNPPPQNPDFVAHSNPPPHNPDFVPSRNSERSSMSFSASLPTSNRQSSHSLFEDLLAPSNRSSNPFEAPQVHGRLSQTSNRSSFVDSSAARNHSGAFSSSSFPVATDASGEFASVPVASVVAISDNDDDSAIPFVSAQPIDEDEERVVSDSSFEVTSPLHVSSPGPAIRAARPRREEAPRHIEVQRRVRPPPLDFSRADERPEWLGRSANPSQSTDSRHKSSHALTTKINWSRISVQAKAIAKDAKRSLKKTLKRETKKLKKSISSTCKPLAKSIREDMDRMSSSWQ